jgi:hypothetical protein
MTQILFTCPVAAIKVQCELDQSGAPSDAEYSQVTCQACTRLHLINRKTGKLLGGK